PITADLVRSTFDSKLGALFQQINFNAAQPLEGLASRPVETRTVSDFLDTRISNFDPADPISALNAKKFADLKATLGEHLTDVHVYNFGESRWAPDVMGQVGVFIVGKTRSGGLAGVFSGAVWT